MKFWAIRLLWEVDDLIHRARIVPWRIHRPFGDWVDVEMAKADYAREERRAGWPRFRVIGRTR